MVTAWWPTTMTSTATAWWDTTTTMMVTAQRATMRTSMATAQWQRRDGMQQQGWWRWDGQWRWQRLWWRDGRWRTALRATTSARLNESSGIITRIHPYPYAHPHHMKVVWQLIYFWFEVGALLNGSLESTTALIYSLPLLRFIKNSKIVLTSKSMADKSSCNVIRIHPYAHPQHMKAMKHLICVWHWSGRPLGWVYGLNHHAKLWFAPLEEPEILGNFQKLGQWDQL